MHDTDKSSPSAPQSAPGRTAIGLFFTDWSITAGFLAFLKTFLTGKTLEWLEERIRRIDPFFKQVFLWIFLTSNAVYLIHTCNILFGNHDFSPLKYGVNIVLWSGRYANSLPLQILTGGNLTPVLNNLLSLAAMTAASMLLCAFFRLPKLKRYWIPAGLLPILLPYASAWFYYAYETVSHSFMPVLAILSIQILREKFTLERVMLSVLLILLALGIYASILSFFGVILLGLFIQDMINGMTFRAFLQRCLKLGFVLLSGGITFKLILFVLKITGKLSPDLYSLDMPTPAQLIRQIVPETILGIRQFFHHTPYIPVPLKLLMLAIIVIGMAATLSVKTGSPVRETIARKILILFFWFGLFFVIMIPDFLTNVNYAFVVRTAYFGTPFLVAVSLMFVFRYANGVSANFAWFIAFLLLWCSIVSDLEIQKNWKIGFQNELLAYSRVLSMIEQDSRVAELKKPFNYFQVGALPSGRQPFCRPKITDGEDSLEFHSFEFNPDWSPRAGIIFNYLDSGFQTAKSGSFRVDMEMIESCLNLHSPEFQAFIKQAHPYPAPSSQCLFVDTSSNSIVVVLNQTVLDEFRTQYGFTPEQPSSVE